LKPTIVVDSREKQKAIKDIIKTFEDSGYKHVSSKLFCGDYALLNDMSVVIDRKQNLHELCGNVCQQHERFRAEMQRAKENGIKIIFLCEHGRNIKALDDVLWWTNPRETYREKVKGVWVTKHRKVMQGDTLFKILNTMQNRYGVEFLFCEKKDTGKRITELLRGGSNDSGTD
jgi:ERCC4-type nuclease